MSEKEIDEEIKTSLPKDEDAPPDHPLNEGKKSFKHIQDHRWGVNSLAARHPVYDNVEASIFSHWKEEYSFFVRLCQDQSTLPRAFWGNPYAAMIIAQRGREIGLGLIESLYSLIPMPGYICMLGDKAYELIMDSGLCSHWVTEETGTIKKGDYKCSVSAHRTDTDSRRTVEWSLDQFKKAKMYISPELYNQVGENALSRSQIIRYKYPERTIKYLCQGWLARDLFSDILRGIRYYEEVQHYDNYEKIVEKDGGEIVAGKPMALVSKARKHSEKLLDTMEIAGQITLDDDNRLEVISEHPDNVVKIDDDKLFTPQGKVMEKEKYTRDEIFSLKGSRAKHLNTILALRGIHLDFLPGRVNPDQKRELILTHQEGFTSMTKYIGETWSKSIASDYTDLLHKLDDSGKFIKTPTDQVKMEPQNRYNIRVPHMSSLKPERELEDALDLKGEIQTYIVESEKDFLGLLGELLKKDGSKYTSMIDFCRTAKTDVINRWINAQFK